MTGSKNTMRGFHDLFTYHLQPEIITTAILLLGAQRKLLEEYVYRQRNCGLGHSLVHSLVWNRNGVNQRELSRHWIQQKIVIGLEFSQMNGDSFSALEK